MKILMTLMGLDIGGAETHVMELALELHRQGHTVLLASNGGAYVPQVEAAGIRHVQIPMNQRSPVQMLRSLRLLERLIRTENPDLVHAHARIPAFLCGILQKRMHFPFITTAHWVFQVTPMLRRFTNWGQRTVAVSEDIKTYLMENYQVPEDQIHVTVNGIDTRSYCPRPGKEALRLELGLGTGPVVGLVSRLDQTRGRAAEVLIQTVPALAQAFPDVQVCIVGDGNSIQGGQEMERKLRADAAAVNQALGRQAVLMTGARQDIPRLLDLMDVFVGVSRAALEAMSAGKPVLLAGNEGYLGLLTPEKLETAQASNFCCRGCRALEAEELQRDLLALLNTPDSRRRELGAFGRRVILEQYSAARMARDYLAAYDKLLHAETPLRAVISGYYGYDNLGDDAILESIRRQLLQTDPPVHLTVLSKRPRETERRFGLEAVPRFSPVSVFRALKRSDLLISGGGSLLQDKTSTRSLLYYLAVIRMQQRLHKPVFLYANGIGPLEGEADRRRVRRCVERCDGVTLRDGDSLQELRTLGVRRQDITVTADPVFTLTAAPGGRQRLTEAGVPEGIPVLGVSVRSAAGMDEATDRFAMLLDRISQAQHRAIVFIIMQEPGDEAVSQRIRQRMRQKSYLVRATGAPETMLGIIGAMDAVLSMRLHTIIFAARQRVPVVGCVYDPKVTSFLRMLRMPDCGTPESMEPEAAFQTLCQVLDRREEYRALLEEPVSEMERKAHETPRQLALLLKG